MNPKDLKAVILYNELSANAGPDEADVLDQVNVVSNALTTLGIMHSTLEFSLNLEKVQEKLIALKPDFVFNLVESVNNKGNLIFLAPALLNSLSIPFTGGSLETIFLTTSKTLTKELMSKASLPTPAWFHGKGKFTAEKGKKYIVKPIWEDGSLGLDENCVFDATDPNLLKHVETLNFNTHFVEEYIDGREFNISILAGPKGPTVLPPAEIIFESYEPTKPKVVGYKAKWDESSYEYLHTFRTFDFNPSDDELIKKLQKICIDCWNAFNVNGYARVDFRVDQNGNPYILEINVNPCISPDSGFYAACQKASIPFNEAINRIIHDIPSFKP